MMTILDVMALFFYKKIGQVENILSLFKFRLYWYDLLAIKSFFQGSLMSGWFNSLNGISGRVVLCFCSSSNKNFCFLLFIALNLF